MNRRDQLRNEMRRFGEKLIRYGLAHSQVGNLSVRLDESMLISGHGCPLDELTRDMIVELKLQETWLPGSNASSDAVIHRAIYMATKAEAIIHAHAPYAVAESILTPDAQVVTEDVETQYLLKEIPLIPASTDLVDTANSCAEVLRTHAAIIIRAHGTIGIGSNLKEAYLYVSSVEHACKVRNLCRLCR